MENWLKDYIKDIEDNPLDEQSTADIPINYGKLVEQDVFVGEMSLEAIIESITDQFNDYINIEDRIDYVDIFYNQLSDSYDIIKDDEEDHPEEKREVLDNIEQEFLYKIQELFDMRLTVHIVDIEKEVDDTEFIVRKLYEFFILDARNNFKTVIVSDVLSKLDISITDDREFFNKVDDLMLFYSPLLTTIGPQKFLEYVGESEIQQMYEDGEINGNFCRKYSPKLYQNDEFQMEIINDITMKYQFKQDLAKGIINNKEGL